MSLKVRFYVLYGTGSLLKLFVGVMFGLSCLCRCTSAFLPGGCLISVPEGR